jgi:hypothetical protein
MTDAVNFRNEASSMVIHEALPMDAMTQIFTRVDWLQVRQVCREWNHIVTEMGHVELREIQVTHQIAISIFKEGVEYPVFFQSWVYHEVWQATARHEVYSEMQIELNCSAMTNIVFQFVRHRQLQEALAVVTSVFDKTTQTDILSRTFVLLAKNDQFDLADNLYNHAKDSEQAFSSLARHGVRRAIQNLLDEGETELAEQLFNTCWMKQIPTDKRAKKLENLAQVLEDSDPDIADMITGMRQKETELKALENRSLG